MSDSLCPDGHPVLKEAVYSAFPLPELILRRYSQKVLSPKDTEALVWITAKTWK